MVEFVPSYPVMASAARIMGARVNSIPLNPAFTLPDWSLIESQVVGDSAKLIFLVNPNNPTSNVILARAELLRLLELKAIVVVDEAYVELGGWSAVDLIDKYSNLIVLRSFSKSFSLPGLRIGVMLANPNCTRLLHKIEYGLEFFNTAGPSLAGALAALEDLAYYRRSWQDVSAYRQEVAEILRAWAIHVLDSRTTFLFLELAKGTAASLRMALAATGIIIKNMEMYSNISLRHCMLGLPPLAEKDRTLAAIQRVLQTA
jgi:histidinol-phosphate aminotransferase